MKVTVLWGDAIGMLWSAPSFKWRIICLVVCGVLRSHEFRLPLEFILVKFFVDEYLEGGQTHLTDFPTANSLHREHKFTETSML